MYKEYPSIYASINTQECTSGYAFSAIDKLLYNQAFFYFFFQGHIQTKSALIYNEARYFNL